MKKAALYIRVSTDEQAKHGFSLGEQRHDLEQYAAAHHYAVVDVYADEGNTARKSINKRKELQRLLDDVRAGHIDVILLKCLDRWFRNVRDYYKVQEVLDRYGVQWECTQEDYNTTTTNGRLMLNLKLSIAQNESDQTSDRIKYINEGKYRRKEEVTGKHPFGYMLQNKKLVINEAERPIVEFIFSQYISGYSAYAITQQVYNNFSVSMHSKRIWRILHNETYKGTRYNIPDFCPSIIPAHTFDHVQDIIHFNRRPATVSRTFLFSGKILCPSCGSIMLGKRGKRSSDGSFNNYIYICNKHYPMAYIGQIERKCTYGGGVAEKVIERYLINNIFALLEEYEAQIKDHRHTTKDFQAKIKTINAKLSRLKDLYVDGLLEKEAYRKDYIKLQSELEDLRKKSTHRPKISTAAKSILSNDDFISAYDSLSQNDKKALWQSLIKSIELTDKPAKGRPHNAFKVTFL